VVSFSPVSHPVHWFWPFGFSLPTPVPFLVISTVQVGIYLNFDGNCREAMEFYRGIFGGDFTMISTYGNMPPHSEEEGSPKDEEDSTTPSSNAEDSKTNGEDWKNLILHMRLPISEEMALMGCDITPAKGKGYHTIGNNLQIVLMPKS